MRRVRWMCHTRRCIWGGTWVAEPLSLLLLPALLPACVCSGRVTVVGVVVVTCHVACLSMRRAGCFALGALLVVTCDVTWAAGPLSLVCCARVTVVAVVIVTCDVACLSLRRRRRSLPSKKALMFRVFQALLPLPHALLPRPLMISTRNF